MLPGGGNRPGDWSLSSNAGTAAEVSANIFFRITHADFSVLSLPIEGSVEMTFTPSGSGGDPNGGRYVAPADSAGGTWTGSATIDFDAILALEGIAGGATTIELFTVNNTLETESQNGGSALIDKKLFSITVVPEPGTAALLSLGLVGLAARRRARR